MDACEGRPTDMTLGQNLRVSPSSFYIFFQSEGLILYCLRDLIWDGATVRIGIRGSIVAIQVARARIVTVVSVAQPVAAANTEREDSARFYFKKAMQSYAFILSPTSQRAIFFFIWMASK